jgi:hypothetical protein
MHRCPTCPGQLVYPLMWEQLDAHQWWMQLRCPDCHDVRELILARPDVEEYETTTERAFQRMRTAADQWAQSAMQSWCELFGLALAQGGILPFDFH